MAIGDANNNRGCNSYSDTTFRSNDRIINLQAVKSVSTPKTELNYVLEWHSSSINNLNMLISDNTSSIGMNAGLNEWEIPWGVKAIKKFTCMECPH